MSTQSFKQIEEVAIAECKAAQEIAYKEFEAAVKAATEQARAIYQVKLYDAQWARDVKIAKERKALKATVKPVVDIAQVASVYSGAANKCMCGCSGKYRYAAQYQDWSTKERGYQVDDDEISDKSVKVIVAKINEAFAGLNEAEITDKEITSKYVTVTIGQRVYVAYLVD
jgi:hypothetical protein